ncbi:MAG: acyl-CoA thioesterase [Gammaproteobacteria bacterium]|nr:acyl-CoA thioesterase [Gammaproteobacteria bacterium]MDH5653270.1 acyl-CoA thioesterase [Gammaproteobacteria bacterium]
MQGNANKNNMTQQNYPFSIELAVRDYECDLQGIVNNAIYQHYLEHARHEHLRHGGIDFAKLTAEGIHLVMVRIEIDYKKPLKSGDRFVVYSRAKRESALRFVFEQAICRLDDHVVMVEARMLGAAIGPNGRPIKPDVLNPICSE